MQGAETIIETILNDAKTAAAQTLHSADEKAQLMRLNAQKAQQEAEDKALVRAKTEIAEREKRMMRMAELEAKKAELADKRALIEEAFSGALDQLCAMDADKKRKLNAENLLACAQGGETFCPSKGDETALDAAFLNQMNDVLAQTGKAALKKGEAAPSIRGGFMLMGQGVAYNCSYEALLSQRRDELEAQVASLLFGSAE